MKETILENKKWSIENAYKNCHGFGINASQIPRSNNPLQGSPVLNGEYIAPLINM